MIADAERRYFRTKKRNKTAQPATGSDLVDSIGARVPQDLTTFLTAAIVLVLSPGPNLAIVLGHALRSGIPGGLGTVGGILVGFAVYGLVTALGLASLLRSSPAILEFLRIAGVLYLLWLGIRTMRGGPLREAKPTTSAAFRDGLLTNLLNPKVVLFYVALVPQFLNDAGSVFQQSLLLTGMHAAIACSWFCLVTLTAKQCARWIQEPCTAQRVQQFTGVAIVLFAVRMVF